MEQAKPSSFLRIVERLRLTLAMIKFEHSIFALPFAFTGALLAWRESGFPTESLAAKALWILLAMVGARSAAMTFNRIVDAKIDARNPRTAQRHIPAGALSRNFAWGFFLASTGLFLLASAMLNTLCLALAPVALGIVLLYSYTKRFTSLAHIVLGLSLGIAPSAAWIAMRGELDIRIGWLSLAVLLWTAGFDIIYACQDFDFDRREGLFSIPAKLGIGPALWVSRALHVATVGSLLVLAQQFSLGLWPVAIVVAVLAWEHSLVRASDLSKADMAFFTANGFLGLAYFGAMALEVYRNV
ncbi:MAG: UbiA-like polyprenyltransferase [Bryobacter sp.]|nr:UbiA-like polyprenyltransferase [Bryobacter sp.]